MSTLIYESATRAKIAPEVYGDDDFDVILDIETTADERYVSFQLMDGKDEGILLNREEVQHLRDYLTNMLNYHL